jgi:predicted membrane-bound spermidine synthase
MLCPILAADCFFSVETASFLTVLVLLRLIVGLAANIFSSFGLLDLSALHVMKARCTVLGHWGQERSPMALPVWGRRQVQLVVAAELHLAMIATSKDCNPFWLLWSFAVQ